MIDRLLVRPGTGRRLLIVQTGLAVLIGARIAFGPFRQLAGLPDELFDPVPILTFLHSMPASAVIIALQVLGTAAALAAAFRRWPRVTYGVAWASYLVLAGLRGSRGKVVHNDLLLLWVGAVFLVAPVTARWRDREARPEHGWPIRTATIVTASVYFFAGYHKLRRSGLDWVTGDNMRFVLLWGPSIGRQPLEDTARWIGEHLWAARATAASILTVELTFPLVIVRPRWGPAFAAAAIGLHAGTWLLLGLDYWAWALTVPLVVVDWDGVLGRGHRRAGASTAVR